MAKNAEEKKVRINIEVSPRVREKLGELQKRSEASSLTEVIRRALALYDLAVETVDQGGQLVIEHKNGTEERLVLLEERFGSTRKENRTSSAARAAR